MRTSISVYVYMCTVSGHVYEDIMYIWRGISYLVCTSFHSASPVEMFADRVADCVHVCQDMPLSLHSLSKLSHMCILGQNEHWLIWEVTHALHSGAKSWFSWWSQKYKQHNSYRAYCLWLTAWVQGRWLMFGLALYCSEKSSWCLWRASDAKCSMRDSGQGPGHSSQPTLHDFVSGHYQSDCFRDKLLYEICIAAL